LLPKDYHKIIGLLYASLTEMDEIYLKRAAATESAAAARVLLFSEKRRNIMNAYVSGNHQAVVEGYVELTKVFGSDAIPGGISFLYALSLGEMGNYAEALGVSDSLGPELEKTPGLIHLQAKSIEWQLALGNQEGALKAYEKLADSLKAREATVKMAEQRLVPDIVKAAESPPPSPDVASVPDGGVTESITTEEVLKKADEFVRIGEYSKAKLLLLQHRLRLEEGPETQAIDRALENVEITEATLPAAEVKEHQAAIATQETLRVASALVQGEKYEEALGKLEELAQMRALPQEGENLKALAIEKIINRERNKAAKLFLLARNTADPAKKEDLLKSSHQILKAVAEKYPTSPLNKRINDNIRAIEAELSRLKRQAG